ncbi:MAG: hypothetical protein JW852_09045 [Spirochaetales bacterium]|nr:hypothetical protein [Spirochaetales bacterium]
MVFTNKLWTVTALVLLLVSCVTGVRKGRPSDTPLFYGQGTGATVTQSLNAAKQDVLRQVIDIILSKEVRTAKHDELDGLFFSTSQANAYFLTDSLQVLAQGKDGELFYSSIGIRVDLKAVIRTLEGNNIYGGLVKPGAEVLLEDREPPATVAVPNGTPGAPGRAAETGGGTAKPAPISEKTAVISAYLDSLTFLVYFDADTRVDPFLMKAAVGIANRYLVENGVNLIDLDIVESIKRDQELAYEAQIGEPVGLIQWIAQKLNADIYVEIGAETSSETRDGNYYGQANVTLKFFDSSTAALLASATYRSPRTFSTSSELDAVNNAIQSSVYQAMPAAVDQAYRRVEKMAAEGIPYELIILKPPDSRLMRDFMKELESRTRKVEIMSQSADEARYRVYLIGAIEDLQDIVFDIADSMQELSYLELVYLRGKSITFTSGL